MSEYVDEIVTTEYERWQAEQVELEHYAGEVPFSDTDAERAALDSAEPPMGADEVEDAEIVRLHNLCPLCGYGPLGVPWNAGEPVQCPPNAGGCGAQVKVGGAA